MKQCSSSSTERNNWESVVYNGAIAFPMQKKERGLIASTTLITASFLNADCGKIRAVKVGEHIRHFYREHIKLYIRLIMQIAYFEVIVDSDEPLTN